MFPFTTDQSGGLVCQSETTGTINHQLIEQNADNTYRDIRLYHSVSLSLYGCVSIHPNTQALAKSRARHEEYAVI